MPLARLLLTCLLLAACVAAAAGEWSPEQLYREGRLPGGRPLLGQRGDGPAVEGKAAACVTCHRRSGLGGSEGRIVVPPIIGKYLFRSHATNVQDLDLPHLPGYRVTREPYTPQTLARAIRTGVDASGRTLSALMPRYALDDDTLAALAGYLGQLTSAPEPGVTPDTLHFATVITPDADPAERRAMLDVMTRFFDDKNAFLRGGVRPMQAAREIEYRVTRRWVLHVWELSGRPETWEAQLRARQSAEPVLAMISGLGGADWSPVHRFCESAAMPCLFPNVLEPVVAEGDYYPLYFSRGLHLEADLIVRSLQGRTAEAGARPSGRLVQVLARGQPGAGAAGAVERQAGADGWRVETRTIDPGPGAGPALAALAGELRSDDVLLMWLPAALLAQLPPQPPAAAIYASGLLGRLERAPLPAAWRPVTTLTYPMDPPQLRRARVSLAMGWFRIRGIVPTDERIPVDTYVACSIASEMVKEMLDSFVRDFLVERVETMLGHRLNNGYYPRLSLAAGQRFASKGGYLAHLAERDGGEVVLDSEWLVP